MLREQHLHRSTTRLECLERAAVPHTPALLLEELADRRAQLHLVVTRTLDVSAAAENPCPSTLFGAEPLEPFASALHDVGHVAERLDVVHNSRLPVEALDRRERRLETRLAAKPFERFDERRLLPADVCTGTAVHDDVAIEAAAENVVAD